MRLVSGTLLQVAPELEEAGRTTGASETRVKFDVTLPLIRAGMLTSWLLIFLIFVREYSTGIYLLGPGTEVIGSLVISLWGTGAIDLVSALSVVNVGMIGIGLLIAIRLGVRLHG
jgi:iron(III) transport system permease protein